MALLRRTNALLYAALSALCAGLLVVMIVTIFIQVVARYILQVSTPWAEEVAVYSFIWAVLLGTSLGVRDGSHLVADLLPEDLLGPATKLLATFNYIMVGLVGYIFVRYGYDYAVLGMTRYSFGLRIPMVYLYAAMPITGVFLFLFLVERLISLWTGEERRP